LDYDIQKERIYHLLPTQIKVHRSKEIHINDWKPTICDSKLSKDGDSKLRKDGDSKSTNQRQYMSMIGNLLYVTTSRPDVMQAVG
jgi:hypothetical protein